MPLAKLERLLKPVTRSTTLPPIVLTVRALGRVNGAAISHALGCEYGGYANELKVELSHNPWDGLLSLTSPNGRRWLCLARSHSWAEERDIIDSEPTLEFRGCMCGFDIVEIQPKRKFSNAPGVMFVSEYGVDRSRLLTQWVLIHNRRAGEGL